MFLFDFFFIFFYKICDVSGSSFGTVNMCYVSQTHGHEKPCTLGGLEMPGSLKQIKDHKAELTFSWLSLTS